MTKLRLAIILFLVAFGSIASPEWTAEPQGTQGALAGISDDLIVIAPTYAPTMTPIPLTATRNFLPTATLVLTSNNQPTIEPTEAPPVLVIGDSRRGHEIFTAPYKMPDGLTWACATCHSVTPDQQRLIGPGLWEVSVRSLTYAGVTDPVKYIIQSIINPQAFITPPRKVEPDWPLPMPTMWAKVLSPQEIDDLVAYLMILYD